MDYETEWQFDAQDLAALRGQLESRSEFAGFQLRHCAPRDLTDHYLDTADTRLAHAGFALRLRCEGAGCEATLKSLRSEGSGPLVRKEISQPLPEGSVTALLAASGPVSGRIRAVAGGQSLEPLLSVRTHRDVFQLLDGDVDAAEIVLDDSRFGEADEQQLPSLQRVEVELHAAAAASLEPVLAELRGTAELEPATQSKLAVGLAARGYAPPATTAAPLPMDAHMPAVAAGQQLLLRQLAVWRHIEPGVRMGDDPEALHQLRVAGRRIIAILRLLEAAPLSGVLARRRRLQALLRRLSPLRDLDVQRMELESVNASLASGELSPLLTQLQVQRERRQHALLRILDAPRTQQLLRSLDACATQAPARRQQRSIAVVTAQLLRQRYRRVRRHAQLAFTLGTVEQCHQLRLQAKKLRYIAEPLVELYGEPMQRFLRRLQQLQSLLGQINDAHHAVASLERLAQRRMRLPATALFAMGRVAERQRQQLESARQELPDAWRCVRGKAWRRLRAHMRVYEPAGDPQLPPYLSGKS